MTAGRTNHTVFSAAELAPFTSAELIVMGAAIKAFRSITAISQDLPLLQSAEDKIRAQLKLKLATD